MDHDEADRRRMLTIIDLFRERDTIDELGLQAIWDAFAELLFPGTGTVQTRARYFLLVPWIYQGVEKRGVPTSRVRDTVRKDEIRLIRALLAGGSDQTGIVGSLAQAKLQRMPSTIYWSGLGRLGIRRFPGTADQMVRALDGVREMSRGALRTDDGELVSASLEVWDRSMPSAPDGLLDGPTRLELRHEEATYLRARVRDSATGSLLDVLLDVGLPARGTRFPWQHAKLSRFPADLRRLLDHARRYSEAMHGAQLLYNLLLFRVKDVPEWVERLEERLDVWKGSMSADLNGVRGWDREEFWATVGSARHVSAGATDFVNRWCDVLVRDGFNVDVDASAITLITERERTLKGGLARLGNQRAIDRLSGLAGDRQYEFRWLSARAIVKDILDGLALDPTDA
jgi:hypothetical protein